MWESISTASKVNSTFYDLTAYRVIYLILTDMAETLPVVGTSKYILETCMHLYLYCTITRIYFAIQFRFLSNVKRVAAFMHFNAMQLYEIFKNLLGTTSKCRVQSALRSWADMIRHCWHCLVTRDDIPRLFSHGWFFGMWSDNWAKTCLAETPDLSRT